MVGPSNGNERFQRSNTHNSDNDEDEVEFEDEESDEADRHSSKRLRMRSKSVSSQAAASIKFENIFNGTLKADIDGYIIGSIVRVTLKNFLTYDFCEFFPGPHLNMIIGPNGTGKSAIVCAIMLGLGGKTDFLGRAREISDFVKSNKERASIEIELKSKSKNTVIKRYIKKTNNTSIWNINGQQATFKDVAAKMASLNIQLDNLCQILPQDKVVQFAQMTPIDLLKETQRAVGSRDLTTWHEELIRLRNEEKAETSRLDTDRESLKTLESRNAVIERDVVRFQERERIMRKVKALQLRLPFAKYAVAKMKYDDAKKNKLELTKLKMELEANNSPVEDKKNELKGMIKDIGDEKKALDKDLANMVQKLAKIQQSIERTEGDGDEIRQDLQRLKKREKAAQIKIKELRIEITNLEAELQGDPPSADTSEIQPQIDATNQRLRDIKGRTEELINEQNEIKTEGRDTQSKIDSKRRQLEEGVHLHNRRLEALRRIDPDCAQAVEWIRQHTELFEQPVFEPACLNVQVRDQRHVNVVEQVIFGDLKTFVCQNKKDYDLITLELIEKMRWRLTVVCFPDKSLANYPTNTEMLRQFNMEHYVLGLIDGPPAVLASLCELHHIHQIPVSFNERLDPRNIVEGGPWSQFVIGQSIYSLKRYKYGSGGVSTKVTPLRPANFLKDSINLDRQRQLQRELDDLRDRLTANEARVGPLKNEENSLRKEDTELRAKKEELAQVKKQIVLARQQWERKKVILDNKKTSLANELSRVDSTHEVNEIKKKLRTVAGQRAKSALEYKTLVKNIITTNEKRTISALKQIELNTELTALDKYFREKDKRLHEVSQELHLCTINFQQTRDAAKKLLDEVTETKRELTKEPDVLAIWQEVDPNLGIDDLEQTIISEQAKADLHYAPNPKVLEDFEKRKQQIETLKHQVSMNNARLSKLKENIGNLKTQWKTKLDGLVGNISEKFSEAFGRIGCHGEVHISEHDDFDKWGLEIQVKFRNNENLQALTGQRQSGGERAVSTILYLMALQELVVIPFRVVDEINQGMDPRNERLIHKQMVEVATRDNTPQYFLITPKLLPDLEYHERMKILCVYNGPWLPERMNWRKYISSRRNAMTAA